MTTIEQAKSQIQEDITNNDIMLYMKGDKNFPMCGFSNQVVKILNHMNVDYETRNVLDDESLRTGIKEFSNWPTIPQLYVKAEFIGGCDIVTEMYQNGELQKELEQKVG